MHNLIIYIGTSARDIVQYTALINSIKAYNVDNIPVYTCVNDGDIEVFKKNFDGSGIVFIKDSDVYQTTQTDSWWKQQLIKMNFWRLGIANNMVQIDSDSFFIKNFRVSDFMVDENTPYTVIHENKELKEFFVRNKKDNSLQYDNGDYRVSQGFASNSNQIKEVLGTAARTTDYDFGHPPCVWSNDVWKALYEMYIQPNNLTYETLISYANSEQQWYGETLLALKLFPIFPKENMFKTFHYKENYDEFISTNSLLDIRYNYHGICLQSSWSSPMRGNSPEEFSKVYSTFFTDTFTPKMFSGQFSEDEWIVSNFKLPTQGTIVDVGADQPILGSNTYFFEKYLGWNSICIDGDARVIDKLKTLRKTVLHTLVSDTNNVAKFNQTPEAGISHISNSGNVELQTRTLNSILEEHNINEITLLDIDVEGHELEVCNGLDWNRYKPQIVIIEYISPAGGNIEEKLRKYFDRLGCYQLVHISPANYIYVRNETI
jgi:FkbM family methyltransferase